MKLENGNRLQFSFPWLVEHVNESRLFLLLGGFPDYLVQSSVVQTEETGGLGEVCVVKERIAEFRDGPSRASSIKEKDDL